MKKSLLKNIPLLSKFSPHEIKLQRLAGLTNENYLVTVTTALEQRYILRIPREPSNHFINRDDESHNTKIAEQLGIAPKNLWRNSAGASLTEYLKDASTPNINDPKVLEEITKTLVTLHNSKAIFKGELNRQKIAKYLTQYFELCSHEQQQSLKTDYQKTLFLLESSLSKRPVVPSHIDLMLENIMQQGEEVWFIDWEYSAMASPFWDIATFCNSAQFDSAQSLIFLKVALVDYQQGDIECLTQYRFITKTVSDCWQVAFQKLPE